MKDLSDNEILKRVRAGLRLGIANAIERHRRLGESIVISENGKIKVLTPDQILELQKKTFQSTNKK